MRRAARTDGNHEQISKAYKRIGAVVIDVSRLGEAGFDLLIGFRKSWFAIEIKDSEKFSKKFFASGPDYKKEYLEKLLTDNEKEKKDLAESVQAPYKIVYDIDSAINAIGANKPSWK